MRYVNYIYITVRDPKVSHFLKQKTLEKWDTLGTFTHFWPIIKQKMKKVGHFGVRHFGVMDCKRHRSGK